MHKLQERRDQGFLQIQCELSGSLDLDLFRSAWNMVFNRYQVLKSSIHWENLEKPMQVVRDKVEVPWEVQDWSGLRERAVKRNLDGYLKADRDDNFDLNQAPVSRIAIFELNDRAYKLVWSSHHLILDGWSSAIIIREVFDVYTSLVENTESQSQPDKRYSSFVDWYKNLDQDAMRRHWLNLLDGYQKPALLTNKRNQTRRKNTDFQNIRLALSEEKSKLLTQQLRASRVTMSSLMFGLWGMIMAAQTGSQDVVFGTTVSGRSGDLTGMEQMVGQFSNVIPIRIQTNLPIPLDQWLASIQKQQSQSSKYEQATLNQITSWCNWPGYLPLFDSLILLENFPWKDLHTDELQLKNYKSGITTTFPINILVIPGSKIELTLRYDQNQVTTPQARRISNGLLALITAFSEGDLKQVDDLTQLLESQTDLASASSSGGSSNFQVPTYVLNSHKYAPPTNPMEIQLARIWEQVLGLHPISITDNFFELGGNSLLAVQLFDEIKTQTGSNLPPSMLLQHPTIQSLAQAWNTNTDTRWSSLVPLRASGSKPPLFTIHGGGGHVFFYQPLARYLDADQPVFALQPAGLDGESEQHQSIEEMARHYLATIKKVQPEGPFSILGTCLSDPICVEINNQMRENGEAPLAMIIVDSSPFHLFPRNKIPTPKKVRIERFQERFRKSPYRALRKIVVDRVKKFSRPIKLQMEDLRVEYGKDYQARQLLKMRKDLQKMYYKYHWKPFTGKITLIKTSQNKERINNWDEGVWAKLASEKVEVLVTPGQHYTRFEEPDVISMAKKLQEYLDHLYQDNNPEQLSHSSSFTES